MAHQIILVLLADEFHMLRAIISQLCDFLISKSIAVSHFQKSPVPGIYNILINYVAHITSFVIRHSNLQKKKMPPLPRCGMSGGSVFGGSIQLL